MLLFHMNMDVAVFSCDWLLMRMIMVTVLMIVPVFVRNYHMGVFMLMVFKSGKICTRQHQNK